MKKRIFLLTQLFLSMASFAQGETNIWYFGNNAGLDFNSGSPVALTNGQLSTFEGTASISNSAGQLLFYSDGVTVYNKNHQIMPNGSGLYGNFDSSQSSLVIPKPNSSTIYYLFTVDKVGNPLGLCYSEIDMSLNGGLGDVTSLKNVSLITPICERITAVRKTSGDGYWLVSHGVQNNSFHLFSITSAGVNTTPTTTNIGTVIANNSPYSESGCLKFNATGTKLLNCNTTMNLELYDFDAATGTISNPRILNTRTVNYGIEFSPSGNIAYVTSGTGNLYIQNLYQYNLTAPNIAATELLLYATTDTNHQIGQLQIASNKKIYMPIFDNYFVSVINNPDVLGLGCNFQLDALGLGGKRAQLGLPQFVQSYFNATFSAQYFCLGSNTQFTLNASQTRWLGYDKSFS